MSVTLFYTAGSAPCRVVLLVAAALNLQLDLRTLDLSQGEHLQESFLKLNPQHTVPTLVDGEFSLWESRAISRYLVNQYGADSSLYPKEPKARALVDQRLDFDLGTLYPRFADFYYPTIFSTDKPDETKYKKLEDGLKFLDTFLEGQEYVAGDELTLADLSIVATVSTIDAAGISLRAYPNVVRWFEFIKTKAPQYEEANQKGVDDFKRMVAHLKAKSEL